MISIVRIADGETTRWAVRSAPDEAAGAPTIDAPLDIGLAQLLAMPLAEARRVVESAGGGAPATARTLAPVDAQEVWAAGVTYERSRVGRREESPHGDLYDGVYDGERPELFFKAVPWRVVGDGEAVGIRADSSWDVPEPELGLVVNSRGEIFGYLVGNDMSSRSIEGENPLYLPQAKVYDRSCALGPGIVPVWAIPDGPMTITMRIERGQGTVFEGETSTASLHRSLAELVDWLTRAMVFPSGAVLLTGTGLVPDADVTLAEGDTVVIEIAGVGRIANPVTVVGRSSQAQSTREGA